MGKFYTPFYIYTIILLRCGNSPAAPGYFLKTHLAKILGGRGGNRRKDFSRIRHKVYTSLKHSTSRPWLLPICCKPSQRTVHDGTVAISHRKETHGMLTSAITVGLHGTCHTKPQELCARHCVTKQCLGVYLSFVTDVHLSFVTDLPMHLDRIGTRMFRQGCHRQARGTTHRTTYETYAIFLSCRCNPECA